MFSLDWIVECDEQRLSWLLELNVEMVDLKTVLTKLLDVTFLF